MQNGGKQKLKNKQKKSNLLRQTLVIFKVKKNAFVIILKERELVDFKIIRYFQDIYYFILMGSLGLFLFLLTLDRQ